MKAIRLIEATNEAEKNSKLLDLVMPNGKRLGDCTGLELREIGEWMKKMGHRLNSLQRT